MQKSQILLHTCLNILCRTEKSMQDYEETQELNTIAPEKPPSPEYPPEVRIIYRRCLDKIGSSFCYHILIGMYATKISSYLIMHKNKFFTFFLFRF